MMQCSIDNASQECHSRVWSWSALATAGLLHMNQARVPLLSVLVLHLYYYCVCKLSSVHGIRDHDSCSHLAE